MTLLWLVTAAALLVALAAWRQTRQTARRLDELSHMYWELKYQQGELRARLDRPGAAASPDVGPGAQAQASASGVSQAFVPLTSLKR